MRRAPPMLEQATSGRSDLGPMVQAYAHAEEAEPDVHDAGPSVLVTFDRTIPGADAQALAVWQARHVAGNDFLTVKEAARIAKDFDASQGPLVIADYADNPGAGAHGDAVTGDLGGKNAPPFGGGPLRLTGRNMRLSDGAFWGDGPILGALDRSHGPTAGLRVDGVDILVVTEPEQLAAFGIIRTEKSALALQSMQHFRAAFEPIAGRVIVCDSGALATPDLVRKPYHKPRHPVWPLDPGTAYSGGEP